MRQGPIFADLANPELLAEKARSLIRFHRPGVEVGPHPLDPSVTLIIPYDIIFGALDAVIRRSIDPMYSRKLTEKVASLALEGFDHYDQIIARRIQEAETLAADLQQQGKKVIIDVQ